MSEAELHILKSRLREGLRHKAARGEVLNHPPIGYVKDAAARQGAGDFVIDPDAQVQAVVRLIFAEFPRQGSVNGLLCWLVRNDVRIPVRPHFGPRRGQLEWHRPNRPTLLNLLHHPIYAGAYRWGHREVDPRNQVPGRPNTGRTLRSPEDCRVLIRGRFAAYITWDEFGANQRRLAENRTLGEALSAPRHGPSMLAGLVVCGRCGHRMLVAYGNPSSANKTSAPKTLRYSCQREAIDYGDPRCQSLSGVVLESFVAERLLEALTPASLDLSLSAAADIERQRQELDDHWQQRLTRSRYDIGQARKQYAAVDPEHRLVAGELERRWEEALRADEQLQAEYARFQSDSPRQLSPSERQEIEALAADLPSLWAAESTTPADRQRIARLLLEEVLVTVAGESERVQVALRWAGGCVSRHTLVRPVQTYEQLANYSELMGRIEALRAERKTLAEIAERLNAEGFHPPKRTDRFTKAMLSRLLRERKARRGEPPGRGALRASHSELLGPDEWWLPELAAELAMPIATLQRWQRVGWVTSRKVSVCGGRWAVYADADELERLRRLRKAPRGWPQAYPTALTTPQPNEPNEHCVEQ